MIEFKTHFIIHEKKNKLNSVICQILTKLK